tara:strand:- start:548 stop:697 length:150 start_codon:yes stop_codon:yes gene_type:complete
MENLTELKYEELIYINGGLIDPSGDILFLYNVARTGFSFGQWLFHAVND